MDFISTTETIRLMVIIFDNSSLVVRFSEYDNNCWEIQVDVFCMLLESCSRDNRYSLSSRSPSLSNRYPVFMSNSLIKWARKLNSLSSSSAHLLWIYTLCILCIKYDQMFRWMLPFLFPNVRMSPILHNSISILSVFANFNTFSNVSLRLLCGSVRLL